MDGESSDEDFQVVKSDDSFVVVELEKSMPPTVISLMSMSPEEPQPVMEIDRNYIISYQPKSWKQIYSEGFTDLRKQYKQQFN